jgi:hypothetical protein
MFRRFICICLVLTISLASTYELQTNQNITKLASDSLCLENAFNGIEVWVPRGTKANERISPLIPLGVVSAQNILLWGWNRAWQKDYAYIDLSTMRTNLRKGFVWDDNEYPVNMFGHPYQGAYYHITARSAGYSFYPSALYTFFGSLTWELFMENEYPSTNDLIVTSLAGPIVGEILHRLYRRVRDYKSETRLNHYGAFLLSPMSYVGDASWGKRDLLPPPVPLNWSFFIGGGTHIVSKYSYANQDVLDAKIGWKGQALNWGMDLSYGTPGRRVRTPLDYFTIHYAHVIDRDGGLLNLELLGTLKNFAISSGNNWIDLSLQSWYDVMWGVLVEMGATALGASVDFQYQLNPSLRVRLANRLGWLVLGATDFNYEDVILKQDPTLTEQNLRTYQLGTGAVFKNLFEMAWRHRWRVSSRTSIYSIHTYPTAAPHYDATGWDVVARHEGLAEYHINRKWALGYRVDGYWKVAIYSKYDPIARVLGTNALYLRYIF